MMQLWGIGFTAPWLLWGLLGLPVLWVLLRAVPPAPIKQRFPGVALLLGLRDRETQSDRTPLWLLLLRMFIAAAIICGLAGPVLNPSQTDAQARGPLLIVVDATWAGAPKWDWTLAAIGAEIDRAGRTSRPVALLDLARPEMPVFGTALALKSRAALLRPAPWTPRVSVNLLPADRDFDTVWFTDGLEFPGRADLNLQLQRRGTVLVSATGGDTYGLSGAALRDAELVVDVVRRDAETEKTVAVQAQGTDPAGNPVTLAVSAATFAAGATRGQARFAMPAELRARITHIDIAGHRSAGATYLVGDTLKRREIALVSGGGAREVLELLSPLHYLEKALEPNADLLRGGVAEIMPANPDVIILADIGQLPAAEVSALEKWVREGGILLRFAGPRVAASDVSRGAADTLMPVRLRPGGRSTGGAMSWGAPKTLAPFPRNSPFFGLSVPPDVNVTTQVMAEPDPNLAARTIAALSDGTPLVTRQTLGVGQIVLFHVTASADWSNLPLSGLFVGMLERVARMSVGAEDAEGNMGDTLWNAQSVIDGFGVAASGDRMTAIAGSVLQNDPLGPGLLPGVYQAQTRIFTRNTIVAGQVLTAATWPGATLIDNAAAPPPVRVGGILLALALAAMCADIAATLALGGRLLRGVVVLLVLGAPDVGVAQDGVARIAASEIVLAHVVTGDARVDDIAAAGLAGLSQTLNSRTSVEPAAPIGVDLEVDELAFYPLLYWPIVPSQVMPTPQAFDRLNAYLRSGGMILFDTRDGDISGFGGVGVQARKLQELAAPLDIPPLEPIPNDHILTRTFYLLQDFPGRFTSRDIWVEASQPGAGPSSDAPFQNLKDGVTPVVIGGNDWASAWAVGANGAPLVAIGRGFAGDRQRELARRFGVNLVMHVLTGNYKSDQVHIPALLDRLGQ